MAAKKQTFSKVKAVKDAARHQIGAPRSTQSIPDAKKKQEHLPPKHRPPLGQWPEEAE
jgi:hypothetical protein